MNPIIANERNKKKCQKFTPLNKVDDMLDLAGYSRDLFGKKVLEYSFGSGNIIKQIVKRYVEDALTQNIDVNNISSGLSADIYGIELAPQLYDQCISDLNEIVRSYGISTVNWSFVCTDALQWTTDIKFDFIIGNPPYISYHDIDETNRKFIRQNFRTCKKGKFDYCYAFLEKGVDLLASGGKMVQLIPSNIYKNVFADDIRKKLLPGISTVWEYPNSQLFEDTLTSSSILVYESRDNIATINYRATSKANSVQVKKKLLGDKWVFLNTDINRKKTIRFGSRYHASIAVATQLNKAFIVKEEASIEPGCLRKGAAPRSLRRNVKEQIIFPYYYDEKDTLMRYEEDDFKSRFPNTYEHLLAFKDKLIVRDADKSAKWYEYGRSQALSHLHQEKLLLSTVVTNTVEVYYLAADDIPYSGIYITVSDGKSSLQDALTILQSKDFLEYISNQGLSVSGKSKRITCKDINDYQFEEI